MSKEISKVRIHQGDLLFVGGRWKEVECTYHVGGYSFADVRGEDDRFPVYQPTGVVDKFLGFNHFERRNWYASDEAAFTADESQFEPEFVDATEGEHNLEQSLERGYR